LTLQKKAPFPARKGAADLIRLHSGTSSGLRGSPGKNLPRHSRLGGNPAPEWFYDGYLLCQSMAWPHFLSKLLQWGNLWA
jgi:hypothetical protein